jgi:hypothetical protein
MHTGGYATIYLLLLSTCGYVKIYHLGRRGPVGVDEENIHDVHALYLCLQYLSCNTTRRHDIHK